MILVQLLEEIFVFFRIYFLLKKEIKKAKLESLHLWVLFTIFCFTGLPIMIVRLFKLWKYDNEDNYNKNESSDEEVEKEYIKEIREQLEEIKNRINLLLKYFR